MTSFFQQAKGDSRKMEDTYVATQDYIAVFDGATPKTAFRFEDGRTPGQVAAQTLAEAVKQLPARSTANEAIRLLTEALHSALQGHSGEASGVIYSLQRNEIWRVGDCPLATIDKDGNLQEYRTVKRIDALLSDWRSSIVKSYLSRGIKTEAEIIADDPGRKIIQPFITRQTMYENSLRSYENDNENENHNENDNHNENHNENHNGNDNHNENDNENHNPNLNHNLAFGVFDGKEIPERFIEVFPIGSNVETIILATDGYPVLRPTLEETEIVLQQMLQDDPLCIGVLKGTKGIQPGNCSFDDRTYIKIQPGF